MDFHYVPNIILKNFNTKILNFSKINNAPSFLVNRKNLNFYKFFSTKGLSSGSINFDIYKNIQLHDHLIEVVILIFGVVLLILKKYQLILLIFLKIIQLNLIN